jgi:hypothetical protein
MAGRCSRRFNAELDAALDRLHLRTREFIGQSLRGVTQTTDNLFGAGHQLIEKLKVRIDQAVELYIAVSMRIRRIPFFRGGAAASLVPAPGSSRRRAPPSLLMWSPPPEFAPAVSRQGEQRWAETTSCSTNDPNLQRFEKRFEKIIRSILAEIMAAEDA